MNWAQRIFRKLHNPSYWVTNFQRWKISFVMIPEAILGIISFGYLSPDWSTEMRMHYFEQGFTAYYGKLKEKRIP